MKARIELPSGGSGTEAVTVEPGNLGLYVTVVTGGGWGAPAECREYVSIPMLVAIVHALYLSRNSVPPLPDGTDAVMDALLRLRSSFARRVWPDTRQQAPEGKTA
jgi:hypothetical protein